MDDGLSEAVIKVFVELYNDGLIYKDKRLVNWDPKLKTAISDLEVDQRETLITASDKPSSMVNLSLLQSHEAPNLLNCSVIVPPDFSFHFHISLTKVLPRLIDCE